MVFCSFVLELDEAFAGWRTQLGFFCKTKVYCFCYLV